MQARTRRRIQIFLAAALLVTTLRVLWIFYQRRRPPPQTRPTSLAPRPVNPDYYVHPPRSYLTDLKSAQRLKGSPVWVRDGYRYPHFPFDARTRRTGEIKDPPLLPPIQKITITDVVAEPTRRAGTDEINLIFEDLGSSLALHSVTIGHCDRRTQTCRFYLDEMFFLKDPRELYSHWTPEIWKAIERHEVKEGMSETQISFALGYGRFLRKQGDDREVEFRPPGRPPLAVTFGADGNAHRIH